MSNGKEYYWNGLAWALIWLSLTLGIGSCTYLENISIAKKTKISAEAKLIEAKASLIQSKIQSTNQE